MEATREGSLLPSRFVRAGPDLPPVVERQPDAGCRVVVVFEPTGTRMALPTNEERDQHP